LRLTTRRGGGAGVGEGAGGAGTGTTGSTSVKPWCREAGRAGGNGNGATAAGACATVTGGGAGIGGDGIDAGTAGAVSRTEIGPPGPGRNPGIPNCRDRTSACSNRDTNTPIASRRSEAPADMTGRAAVAVGMLVVSRQEMKK
jgi:hypothetical protein